MGFELTYDQLLLPLFNHPYAFFIQAILVALATWYFVHRKSNIAPPRLTKQVPYTGEMSGCCCCCLILIYLCPFCFNAGGRRVDR